jgi:hypothetical protein
MTLIIQKPTGAKLNLRQTWQPMDPDAAAYITAVETADAQALEERTKIAIDNFVLGCKEDGIWSAIKASCILSGARTLAGALVPLAGTAPTNVGGLFVSGDYNRKTGLVGNGTTKYLNSNRSVLTDPIDNRHFSTFNSSITGNTSVTIGCFASPDFLTYMIAGAAGWRWSCNTTTQTLNIGPSVQPGFAGVNKIGSGTVSARFGQASYSASLTNSSLIDLNAFVFARNNNGTADFVSNARIAFYSIGESLDLALLDARVTDLINAIGAAIP